MQVSTRALTYGTFRRQDIQYQLSLSYIKKYYTIPNTAFEKLKVFVRCISVYGNAAGPMLKRFV